MKLTVRAAAKEDVYRDIARIPEEHRKTSTGAHLKEGTVCRITCRERRAYVLMRGASEFAEPALYLDEMKRNELGVAVGDTVDVLLEPAGFRGELDWAWHASDPAYRVSARLAVWSFWLGALGLLLGLLSLRSCVLP